MISEEPDIFDRAGHMADILVQWEKEASPDSLREIEAIRCACRDCITIIVRSIDDLLV